MGSFGSDSGSRPAVFPGGARAAICDLPRLGQSKEADHGAECGDRAERDEGRTVARANHNEAS